VLDDNIIKVLIIMKSLFYLSCVQVGKSNYHLLTT